MTMSAEPATTDIDKSDPYRIVIVEDDRSQALFAEAILRGAGMLAEVVSAPERLMATMEQFSPDLVLMDLHMPEMDGLESTQRIRALPAPRGQVPVVVLTANALEEARQDAAGAGASGFLTKPLRVQELQAVVRNCQAAPHRRQDQEHPEPSSASSVAG